MQDWKLKCGFEDWELHIIVAEGKEPVMIEKYIVWEGYGEGARKKAVSSQKGIGQNGGNEG